MAVTEYYVKEVTITGTQDSPETIAYYDLTDVSGLVLPTTFDAAPFIAIAARQQDRDANIVDGSRTTTNFQIALSNLMGDITSSDGIFDLIIVGEPV